MLLTRGCVDRSSDFLATTKDEMAATPFYVLMSFYSRDVFCTLGRLFVRPGFLLYCAGLAVIPFIQVWAVYFREFS